MRYFIGTLLLTISIEAHAQSVPVYGSGVGSCGKFLSAVHGQAPGKGKTIQHDGETYYNGALAVSEWVQGYVSAYNMHGPSSVDTDYPAMDVWLRKWCGENPTKSLVQAARAFVTEHRK